MSDFEKDVQGLAVYIELRKAGMTIQSLIVPEGFSTTQGIKNPVFFRRMLTTGVSKRKWRAYNLPMDKDIAEQIARGAQVVGEELEAQQKVRLANLSNYFRSAATQGYKLINNPIYVEATKEDIEAAAKGTLPTKLWTRVKSSRTAAGYPEDTTSPASAFAAFEAEAPSTPAF